MRTVITNGDIFDGDFLLTEHAVVIEGTCVVDVIHKHNVPEGTRIEHDLAGGLLIPGFVDLQVNGGGGILFNDAPTVESLRKIGTAHRQFGTAGFLPTLITTSTEVMRSAVSAVQQAIDEGVPGVLGIHFEGPFLNDVRKGTHDSSLFREMDAETLEIVTTLSGGTTLVTLAPECTSSDTIRELVAKGVIVCAGHTDATYDQIGVALDAGLRGFTHLFNGMRPLQSREPGTVGAALADDRSWCGLIADGHHIHPASIRVAVSAKKRGGMVLVTDAMPIVGCKESSFSLYGERIQSVDGRCVNSAGSLAGSDLDMITAVNNVAKFAEIDWFEAVKMASTYPAAVIGRDSEYGRIATGQKASMIAFDQQRQINKVWIDGKGD